MKTPEIEVYSDDFLYDDLSSSTVTVGPNITDYEVNVFLFCFLISRTVQLLSTKHAIEIFLFHRFWSTRITRTIQS